MEKIKSFLWCFVILWTFTLRTYALDKSETVSVISLQFDYIALEKSLWVFLESPNNKHNESSKLDKIFETHNAIVSEYYYGGDLELKKYSVLLSNRDWPNNVTEDINYEIWMSTVDILTNFEGLFKYFRGFLSRYFEGEYDRQAILDLCRDALDDNVNSVNIPKTIGEIQRVMLKLYHRAMLIAQSEGCSIGLSPQQFIYNLYSDLALTELKGYILLQFSYMIRQIMENAKLTDQVKIKRQEFEDRIKRVTTLIPKIMATSPRTLWSCDAKPQKKGTTYDEVTRLLQGFIENEVNLNTEDTCSQTCEFYEVANATCSSNKEKEVLFCSRQKMCYGTILDCEFVDADMQVCLSEFKTKRRYDFIEYESGDVLGKLGKCNRPLISVESIRRYLFWQCSYCFCICDEQGLQSDRFFNLRETVSDIENNMVVTGVRLIKNNRIFHLQIQEGELLQRGQINQDSLHWKPVDNYRISDEKVFNGVDFFTMDHNKRQMDLDELTGNESNDIVVGVKFRALLTHINLEIMLCKFDFSSGKLINPTSLFYWKSNDYSENSLNKRLELSLYKPDIPILSPARSLRTSKTNQYIRFTYTDKWKDAAQTTVPFIDTQPVTAKVPLAGIGIIHKGRRGYGGFIAPSIVTYDFKNHIKIPK